jgi:hypothetical protein
MRHPSLVLERLEQVGPGGVGDELAGPGGRPPGLRGTAGHAGARRDQLVDHLTVAGDGERSASWSFRRSPGPEGCHGDALTVKVGRHRLVAQQIRLALVAPEPSVYVHLCRDVFSLLPSLEAAVLADDEVDQITHEGPKLARATKTGALFTYSCRAATRASVLRPLGEVDLNTADSFAKKQCSDSC